MSKELLRLPERTTKPRVCGLTAITDLGVPLQALRDLLADFHLYLDVAKFGVGSAYLTPGFPTSSQSIVNLA